MPNYLATPFADRFDARHDEWRRYERRRFPLAAIAVAELDLGAQRADAAGDQLAARRMRSRAADISAARDAVRGRYLLPAA